MKKIVSVLLVIMILASFSNSAFAASKKKITTSELTEFKSMMMKSVSSQVSYASDFTVDKDKRAVLAALLTLEYKYQDPDFEFDYSKPIYVSKAGKMASVTFFGTNGECVAVIYQSKPLSTSYGYIYNATASNVKTVLNKTSDQVWKVEIKDYNKYLAALIEQLK